jgi:hypothetical protein
VGIKITGLDELQPARSRPIVYCERGAFAPEIKRLWKASKIDLIHFPYDEHDRRWHDKQKIPRGLRSSLSTRANCALPTQF